MSVMRAKNLRLGVSERADIDPPWAWTAGHRAIIEAMFRKYASIVGSFLVRMGALANEIDASIARVFVEAHRRGGCPPVGATSAAWLAAIALDIVDDAAKSHPFGCSPGAPTGGTGMTFALRSPPESIQDFLPILEPEARAIFILFEIDRETSRSIAAAFGLSVEDVHERIVQSQRTFRRAHGDVAAEPSGAPALEALPEVG
jgi:DNA-directed RNA polymerase specialized sigma24 family protein